MPARSRKFSEADLGEPSSKSTFSSLFAHIQDITPAPKRQRTGLNSRFDRMMDTVNVACRSPARRDRTRSAGSSSNSSYVMPTTPLDVYDTLQSGRLGKDFSVIKMRQGTVSQGEDQDSSLLYRENSSNHRSFEALPSWLSDAFLSLDETHPLRLLLPSSMEQPMSSSLKDPNDCNPVYLSDEESPFAFSALEADGTELQLRATALPCSDRSKQPTIAIFHPIYEAWSRFTSFSPSPFTVCSKNVNIVTATTVPNNILTRLVLFQIDSSDLPLADLPDNFNINSEYAYFRDTPTSASQLSHNHLASPYSQQMLTPCSDIPIADYSSDEVKQDEAPISHICFHRREGTDMSRFQNIFSTPGPGYLISRPVHFDSPAESSSSSDPVSEIKYDVECTELDFQWKPYDRSRTAGLQTFFVPSESPADHLSEGGQETGVIERLGQPTSARGRAGNVNKLTAEAPSHPQTSTPRHYGSSPGPFRFALPSEAHQTSGPPPTSPAAAIEDKRQILSKEERMPAFAPAPGIYLSPLQRSRSSSIGVTNVVEDKELSLIERLDKVSSKTSNEISTSNIDESGDVLGSQSSADSIESWG
ncbi:uncharacterized protein EV420DRAFT_1668706 [Desarmillaria tabescens]|uniref:Uncharacterized protein n=1 Tax=Armillaria tabescens TaxID=1929756 RepID=A0AA39TR52_ARMTA|nr:uncharacterized protein EV420DRAFT_1668706 [Desarmillaria tabescens]KAK0461129.1 hypothetical protein EV420DRAFT_1668706 [Desarmillaria tabescens]